MPFCSAVQNNSVIKLARLNKTAKHRDSRTPQNVFIIHRLLSTVRNFFELESVTE